MIILDYLHQWKNIHTKEIRDRTEKWQKTVKDEGNEEWAFEFQKKKLLSTNVFKPSKLPDTKSKAKQNIDIHFKFVVKHWNVCIFLPNQRFMLDQSNKSGFTTSNRKRERKKLTFTQTTCKRQRKLKAIVRCFVFISPSFHLLLQTIQV